MRRYQRLYSTGISLLYSILAFILACVLSLEWADEPFSLNTPTGKEVAKELNKNMDLIDADIEPAGRVVWSK